MAEFWISHKRMSDDGTRIIKVKAMKLIDVLTVAKEIPRETVVKSIEQSNNWRTCKRTSSKRWEPKADVHVLEVDGEKFIRTDKNRVKSDNLGELPDF